MDKFKPEKETVKINFYPLKSRYILLTDKTGRPSAEFRCRGGGVIVSDPRPSSADP